jgi:hypothetical protein
MLPYRTPIPPQMPTTSQHKSAYYLYHTPFAVSNLYDNQTFNSPSIQEYPQHYNPLTQPSQQFQNSPIHQTNKSQLPDQSKQLFTSITQQFI